jgi:hypothetical protein
MGTEHLRRFRARHVACHNLISQSRGGDGEDELLEGRGDPGLIAIAPHGCPPAGQAGGRCRGYRSGGDAFATWHITSTDLDEHGFPLLASVMSRHYADAVAFHGFDGSDS